MASLYPKKISGRTYWYLREMARIDGKPKMVSERTRHLAFGYVAAAWGMLRDLGVAGIIDAEAGPQHRRLLAHQGRGLLLPQHGALPLTGFPISPAQYHRDKRHAE